MLRSRTITAPTLARWQVERSATCRANRRTTRIGTFARKRNTMRSFPSLRKIRDLGATTAAEPPGANGARYKVDWVAMFSAKLGTTPHPVEGRLGPARDLHWLPGPCENACRYAPKHGARAAKRGILHPVRHA